MNFKFAKTLLMGSVMTMGAFGLIACGDDSSSGPSEPSAGDPIQIPTQQDAQINIKDFKATVGDPYVKFQGTVTAIMDSTVQGESLRFFEPQFQVGFVDGDQLKTVEIKPVITKPVIYPTNKLLNFAEMGLTLDLSNPAFTQCGTYNMVLTVKATDGVKDDYTASAQAAFVRNDSYCKTTVDPTPEPEKTEIAMEAVTVIGISTNMAPGLSFAAGAATDALTGDVVFSKAANGEVSMSSATGFQFTTITNVDDYWAQETAWPEVVNGRDAYLSDFKYRDYFKPTMSELIANSNNIYIAVAPEHNKDTGAGIYAFGLASYSEGNNKDFDLQVKFYKVK